MSFSNLRPGSPIYILNKEGVPTVEIGSVVSVSAPMPQFGVPQATTVDLVVKVGDKTGPFPKVPAHAEVDEYKNNGMPTQYVLATSKEGMNAEVNGLRQRAVSIVESVPYNEQVIAACDEMLARLNPELAEKQKQEQEIVDLKKQLSVQQEQMAELISLLRGKEPASKEGKTDKKQ